MKLGRSVRDLWLIEEECVFLNHGSFGATPRVVLEEQDRWRRRMEAQLVRFFTKDFPGLVRETAGALGDFLGAAGEDIVFVDNATTGVNAVLRSFPLEPGDEVLTTDHAYPAVLRSQEYVCSGAGAGLVVAQVPFPISGPEEVIDAVRGAITDRTRLAILDHITSPTALVFPIRELVALCHERGVRVLVDGAHAPGMLPLDVPAIGADYYTGNCHKWLFAPKGCAFLWVAREHQGEVHPTVISHGYGQGFTTEFDWTGTRDPSAWLSLPRGIEFHGELGGAELRERNHELALEGARILADAWGESIPAPDSMFGSMATVRAPGTTAPDLEACWARNDALREEHGVEVPVIPFAGTVWIRVSAQAYNEPDDYRALARTAPLSFGAA